MQTTASTITSSLLRWLRAVFIINTLHTLVVSVVLARADVPFWGLIIPIIFILGFLPGIGGVSSMILASLLGFLVSSGTALMILLVLSAYRLLEELWIQPRIMHSTTSLPLALSYLAPLAGGLIAGPIGALLATPIILVLFVVVRARQS